MSVHINDFYCFLFAAKFVARMCVGVTQHFIFWWFICITMSQDLCSDASYDYHWNDWINSVIVHHILSLAGCPMFLWTMNVDTLAADY